MSSLKTFNHILNTSGHDRYSKWADYRQQLTMIIQSFVDQRQSLPQRTLVVGAGNSDDIQLDVLKSLTQQLFLADIDLEAMQHAVQKYHLDDQEVHCLDIDFTGLEGLSSWDNFVPAMLEADDKAAINAWFKAVFKRMEDYLFMNEYEKTFDLVILSPIYTQLVFQQVLANVAVLENLKYSDELVDYIKVLVLDEMPDILHHFNEQLVRLLKVDGAMIAISDIFEFTYPSKAYDQAKRSFIENHSLDDYHENYVNTYGYGLGDFGLEDLLEMFHNSDHYWLEWPFSEDKRIFVKVELLET